MNLSKQLLAGLIGLGFAATGALAAPIAFLSAVSGRVEVQSGGSWRIAQEGTRLSEGDNVRTDGDAVATIEYFDGDGGATPTTVDVSPDSEVNLAQFEVSSGMKPRRMGLLAMLRGAIRAATKGWTNGSIFSVKAGTTVCGIRGSVASIAFDPATGNASFTNLEGEMFTFTATDINAAITFALQAGTDIAAGRTRSDITPFVPGQQVVADTAGANVVTLTDAQRLALGGSDGKGSGGVQTYYGTTNAVAAKKMADMGYGAGIAAFGESLIDTIATELTGDVKVNAPASDQ